MRCHDSWADCQALCQQTWTANEFTVMSCCIRSSLTPFLDVYLHFFCFLIPFLCCLYVWLCAV